MAHGTHRAAAVEHRRGRLPRVVASLVGAVVVLVGGQGTFAFWTDQASVTTGGFQSGTLDITVNGQLGGASSDSRTVIASLSLSNMVPGESVAASFPLENEGSVPLVYDVTGTGSGGLAVANGLRYSLSIGSTATNTGSAAVGSRTGSCGGVPATDSNTSPLTPAALTFQAGRSLAVGASDTICIVARLASAAPNALQSQSGEAVFVFDASQVVQ